MPDIKTRDVVEGAIKTVDRTALMGQRMKDAYVQTKRKAEHSVSSPQGSTEEYAADQITDTAETVAHEAVHQAVYLGQKVIRGKHRADHQGTEGSQFQPSPAQSGQENPQAPNHAPVPETADTPSPMDNRSGYSPRQQPIQTNSDGHSFTPGPLERAAPTKQEVIRNKQISAAKTEIKAKRPANAPYAASVSDPDISSLPVKPGQTARSGHASAGKSIKTMERTGATIKQTARSAGTVTVKSSEQTIKTASSTVKTVEQVGSTTIKTTQAAARAAQKTAANTARTVQRIRAAAKAAATTAKALAEATVKAAKAIIAAAQELISAIAAGGWVVILVIVIVLMVGLIAGSSFGIFFSSQDTGDGELMKDVVQEINTEYQRQLDDLLDEIDHDEVEMSGSRAVWPEVLAVYAVAVTTDPDEPQEVATIDDAKKAILEDIFWQMNEITYEEETREELELTETDDGEGNIVEEWTEVENEYLLITVTHKTAEEMAETLGFDAAQKDMLNQLLAEENHSLWMGVLYGIDAGDSMIVEVAMSQIGNVGGQPYWSWYGFQDRVPWCACFVSWCANECGYIDAGIIPKFAGCINGVNWFKERGQWTDNSAEPIPGMIIFFDWDSPDGESGPQDGLSDHVGIVEKVENGRVYTVEGNTSNSCKERSYPLGHYEILGYGIPEY